MRRAARAGVQVIAPTSTFLIAFLSSLPPWAVMLLLAGLWAATSVIPRVLDWMIQRDRDTRFADNSEAVRRDLLKLYTIDHRSREVEK
ncbi:hypothetical protein [Nonomuraea sp. NPDC005650]|uniref:hypothetical protein n=1 Tax=Nonomuraea sp. NPDC005650 TaxID=3157045 RepID=UPI0033BAF52B